MNLNCVRCSDTDIRLLKIKFRDGVWNAWSLCPVCESKRDMKKDILFKVNEAFPLFEVQKNHELQIIFETGQVTKITQPESKDSLPPKT